MNWIDITKEEPTRGNAYLITDGKIVSCGIYHPIGGYKISDSLMSWDGCGFDGHEWDYEFKDVTHWMPLPEPPTQK